MRHRLLAVLVAVCWGLNFPATAIALEHFPPLLMVALRFAIIAVPTLLFIPRPRIPVRWLIGVGLGIGTLQFAFLYLSMAAGMPSGLASIVLQASAPFTVVIAGIWLRERITTRQVIGIGVAVLGLAAIAFHRAQVAALLPVVLALCAALGWAIGNVCTRKAQAPNALHLTLWMAVIPPLPMFALSLLVEGPRRIGDTLATSLTLEALPSVLGLLYIVVIATLVGYGIWNGLLKRYPSSTVAPFSMLVPVVGVFASWIAFGEVIDVVELVAGAAVVLGVLVGSYQRRAPRAPRRRRAASPLSFWRGTPQPQRRGGAREPGAVPGSARAADRDREWMPRAHAPPR
jgi:O-acetylserine/cysteine efflux transporter